jgi:hypothetical protein
VSKRGASDNQRSFGLAVALAKHKKTKHSELSESDDGD